MSPHGAMIRKLLPFAALSIGIAATVWLIAAARLTSILDSVARVGWGIAAVVAVRAIMITINGVAWRLSLTKLVEVPYAVFPFCAGCARRSTCCCRWRASAAAWQARDC
jgi:hypothetical protein